jgi:iron complex outermembrane receptor protein
MKKYLLLLGVTYLGCGVAAEPAKTKNADKQAQTKKDTYQGADMVTYGTSTDRTFPDTSKATPTYMIDKADVEAKVNATTVEDTIRYAPGVLIRKRFMGDPNGTLGIRSSNTFQTTHSMVYADGMPLHNRYAPRLMERPDGRWYRPAKLNPRKCFTGHSHRSTAATRWAA